MSSSFRIATILATIALVPGAALARCQTGRASAPFIGAADMRAIDKAAAELPRAKKGTARMSVGTPVSARVKRALVPRAISRVLPQYKGYQALRVGGRLAIVDRRGVLAYLMPLGASAKPGNCP